MRSAFIICFGFLLLTGCVDDTKVNHIQIELKSGKYHKKGDPKPFTGISVEKIGASSVGMIPSGESSLLAIIEDLGKYRSINTASRKPTRFIHRSYVNGVLSGLYVELYPNKAIKILGRFENGLFDGEFYHYHYVKWGHGLKVEINGRSYERHSLLLETMQFASGKPHGKYEVGVGAYDYGYRFGALEALNNSRKKKDYYTSALIKNGVISGAISLSSEAKARKKASAKAMSKSQERALRKLAEDLYDKCQLYGKSYDSRC